MDGLTGKELIAVFALFAVIIYMVLKYLTHEDEHPFRRDEEDDIDEDEITNF